MKIKLKSSEQLNIAFCKLRNKIGIASDDEERQFAMFKKIIRENTEFDEDHMENKLLAEKEELRDQKVIEIAFKRLELIKKAKKSYEENCTGLLKEINGISKTLDEGEIFSLKKREHEAAKFASLSQRIGSLKERMPEVVSKVDRARKVLEDESRRSVGVGETTSYNPLKVYFDIK